MRLYELLEDLNKSYSKEDIYKRLYKSNVNLTTVERIMLQEDIIHCQDYPTFYWKLLATIYFMLKGKKMIMDTNRKSIFEVTEHFFNNIPFNDMFIDKNLTDYHVCLLQNLNDKLLLYIHTASIKNNLHTCECELLKDANFLTNLNFIDLTTSLSHFKIHEEKEYITQYYLDHHRLMNLSKKYSYIATHSFISVDKTLRDLLKSEFSSNTDLAFVLFKKIMAGNYSVNLNQVKLCIEVCKFIINDSSKYINNILFELKLRKVSLAIIILFLPDYYMDYYLITLSVGYLMNNCTRDFLEQKIHQFEFTENNVLSIFQNCNDLQDFSLIYHQCKHISSDKLKLCSEAFILGGIQKNIIDTHIYDFSIFNELDATEELKEKIFAMYVSNEDYKGMTSMNEQFKINLNSDIIATAVGYSMKSEIFTYVYNDFLENENNFLRNKCVILACLNKGSFYFCKLLPWTNSKISFENKIIQLSVCGNVFLIKKFENSVNLLTSITLIRISMDENKMEMFKYLLKRFFSNNHEYVAEQVILKNNVTMLDFLNNHNTLNLKFYLKMLHKHIQKCSLFTISVIFGYLHLDMRNTLTQLLIMKNIFIDILQCEEKRVWLLQRVSVCEFITSQCLFKKPRRCVDYVSSEEESDEENDEDLEGLYLY